MNPGRRTPALVPLVNTAPGGSPIRAARSWPESPDVLAPGPDVAPVVPGVEPPSGDVVISRACGARLCRYQVGLRIAGVVFVPGYLGPYPTSAVVSARLCRSRLLEDYSGVWRRCWPGALCRGQIERAW